MRKIFLFTSLFMLVAACNTFWSSQEMCNFTLTVKLSSQIPGLKADEPLPTYLTKLISPIECNDTIFIPQVKIERLDLPNEPPYVVEVKSKMENEAKKIAQTYEYSDLKDDYSENLEKIPVGNYLVKESSSNIQPTTTSEGSDALIYTLNIEDKNAADSIIKLYTAILKKSGTAKVVIILNTSRLDQEIPVTSNEVGNTKTDNSKTISLPNEEHLRQELLKIIDTKKTIPERENIASKVWKENFYPNVYFYNYRDANDKNPEYWGPGNGKSYIARLVTLPSIIDIKIWNVERDKETQKISGLSVCEIHNGSKLNR